MAKNPAVSVIVPMYKVEQYIKICVDSILAQTFKDFEIILVDDASPDRCFELCKKLYGGNKKVRIVRHEKNLGLGSARNTGIKHARGKYVYFVDSDDYILPHALEKFYNAAEKNNAQVVHAAGRYELVQNADDPADKGTMTLKWEGYSQEGFLPNKIIYRLEKHWKTYATRSNAWLCFCRRDFLEQKHIKFLPIISEDEPFSFALFCFAERYYILHEAFYVHLLRQGSIMRSFNVKRLKQGIQAMLLGGNYIEKIFDKILPRSEKHDAWRENFMIAFYNRFAKNHVMPYYKDKNINPLVNAAAKSTLLPFFGNNESFVRFWLNYCSLFRNRTKLLTNQSQQLLQQNQQLKNDVSLFTHEQPALLKLMETVKTDAKKIFLLGTPNHGNLGDHAIALGEMRILQDFFPQHEIIEIPRDFLTGEFGKLLWGLGLEEYIRRSDGIFLIGGGNLGNLWLNNEQVRRNLIEKFPDNKIVIFPQSICFTNNDAGRRELAVSQKIYNSHKDLHLMTRDETSFNFAKKFFPQIKNYLLPDAATVLQGITDDCDIERKGVLFVLRGDKEKIRDDAKIQRLQEYLTAKNITFTVIDTFINERVTADNREQKIRDVLMKFRAAKVVITDRFHGLIFSFVTRTPVMAFKSFDTKISSGIRWFKNLPSIFYAEGQDFLSMEKFIDEHCFAAAEENFAALNVRVDTDSRERFMRALDKIIGANKIYPIESSDPSRLPESVNKRRLTLDAVEISERRIVYRYSVQGDWQNFFNADAKFFINYSEDISRTPKDIAVIPFLCNVLPIAWVLDAEVVVPELDNDFYEHLPQIKQGYIDMYPRIKFGGRLTVGKFVSHDYAVGNETAAFFSGGADSFDTLIAHAEEHPTLITLLGSDIKLNDREGWQHISKNARETAQQFHCKNLFVASSFRLFLREGALSQLVMPLANDAWWHGFQHGIGIISHAAPYAYLHRLKKIYIASSFSRKYNFSCASDPTIDNHVQIGKCVTVHDGYDFSRQDKLRRICDFTRRTGEKINLHVCWQSSGGKNCCACEKCYRTICGILAEGGNPAEFGFTAYSFEQMHRDFQKPNFKYRPLNWQIIQDRFRERPENLPHELNWLMELNFS